MSDLDDDLETGDDTTGTPDLKPLRKAFKELPEVLARATAAEEKVARLERQIAVKDTPGLIRNNENAKTFDLVAEKLPADADTPEKIQAHFAEYGLFEVDEDDAEALAEAKAAAAVAASHRKGETSASKSITPDDYAGWARDKRDRFRSQHPDAFKSISRGETVSGLTF